MTDNTQLAPRENGALARKDADDARRRLTLTPAVDIHEDAHAVTLLADLPGVPKDKLNIAVHDGSLTIEGESVVPVPAKLALSHVEMRGPHFSRRFSISDDLDTSKIEASLKDGVLKLSIPRRDEAKPRRIEVRVE
jgi:HSP20 family molecular chaperone IbpA